ncbi:MAG: NapC/NirT family cytochrome c [Desulfuromonadales bacterium]|nr:NapC/NirT family cytochrome c [Desulfuromonadales bacterium]
MKKFSRKAWIIVGVAALVIVFAGAGGMAFTSTNNFCVGCHAYEKISWDHGDHPDVGCISCHTKGMLTDKTKGMRKVYLTMVGKVNPHNSKLPSYKEAITENCAGCHMSEEMLALRPIYKDRHEEYRKYAADCVGCHEPGHVKKLRGMREVAIRR